MAMIRTARAKVKASSVSPEYWMQVRQQSTKPFALEKVASAKVVLDEYDPSKYLLSHCTIVASVDTENSNLPLGKHMVNGVQIDRTFPDFYVTANTEKYINNNKDGFERKLLLSSFRTFIGAQNYCEHVQVPELSKGKIIDAAARDIGDSVYIDILVATERKHVQLVKDIASGVMSTLSMGAQISFSICTFCGNVAYDEAQLCPHVKYAKGTTFIDANGQQRIVAELCGHVSADGSVKFIEASWVGIPAFTGAVVRGLLEESPGQVINAALEDKIRLSFQSNRVEDLSKVRKVASQQQQQVGGEDSTQAPPPDAPESSSLSKPSEELYKALVESVKSKVETELTNADKKKTEDIMDSNRSNESMVKSAALVQSALAYPKWQRRAKAILSQTSDLGRARKILAGLYLLDMGGVAEVARTRLFTGSELLGIVRMRDHFEKKSSFAGESRLNSVVISVGSMRKFATSSGYLEACSKVLGRQPNKMEEVRLLEKGQIFSLGT